MWRGNGKELFYLSQGTTLMAVPIDLTRGGITPDPPQPLFVVGAPAPNPTRPSASAPYSPTPTNTYAVTADGQRFFSNARPQQPTAEPLTVVINWLAALRPRSR